MKNRGGVLLSASSLEAFGFFLVPHILPFFASAIFSDETLKMSHTICFSLHFCVQNAPKWLTFYNKREITRI